MAGCTHRRWHPRPECLSPRSGSLHCTQAAGRFWERCEHASHFVGAWGMRTKGHEVHGDMYNQLAGPPRVTCLLSILQVAWLLEPS